MADGGKVIIKIDGDDSGFKDAMGGLGKVGKTALKGIAIGAAAVTTGIAAIGKSAISAYGDYEQLVGGVETLFGAGGKSIEEYAEKVGKSVEDVKSEYNTLMTSQQTVLDNANKAFQTAGMSANQYMETVTSFSASLLQSVGGDTKKAAEMANTAVIDMSDNANKMGTDIQRIQDAYQGFAKQNYTMLDNLKLGYGGTKTEMERLLKTANEINAQQGVFTDYSIDSFADITEAIHVIQTEMGITGTTSLEAATTIQGSLAMTKAAWENLMTGLTDPDQDLSVLIDNLLNSVTTLGENLMPRITQVLGGISTVISQLAPPLIQAITELIPELLPAVVDGVQAVSEALIGAFPVIIEALLSQLPSIIETALEIVVTLAMGIAEALPELIPSAVEAVITIVETLIDNVDMLIDAAIAIIIALAEGLINSLPTLIEKAPEIVIKLVNALVENAPKLVTASLQLMITLGKGLITAIPTLIANIPQIITAMVSTFTAQAQAFLAVGKNIVQGIWNGISGAAGWLYNQVASFAKGILDKAKAALGIHSPSTFFRDQVGAMIDAGIAVGIDKNASEVEKALDSMNKTMLESEYKYLSEKQRLEDEAAAKALQKKYDDAEKELKQAKEKAKDAAAIQEAEAKYAEKIEQIKQDEINNTQKKEQDAYLAQLKETADREKKIYEARQKDIENAKQEIKDAFQDLADAAFDSIEEVEKAQSSLADKLKDFGDLYTTTTKKRPDGTEYEIVKLSDIEKQTQALQDYADKLQAVKERGEVPQEFFATLRDLSVEEGTKFADALLKADDKAFNKYIEDWKQKQEIADDISKVLYADEAQQAKDEIENSFNEFDADLNRKGAQNAKAWGDAFIAGIKETMPKVLEQINYAFSNLVTSPSYAVAGGSGVTNNYTTYTQKAKQTIEIPVNLGGREVDRLVYNSYENEKNRLGIK